MRQKKGNKGMGLAETTAAGSAAASGGEAPVPDGLRDGGGSLRGPRVDAAWRRAAGRTARSDQPRH